MKKKSLSRHSNTALNLTPHYKANLFDSGGPFANMTTAGLWDDSTKATLNNTSGAGSVSGVFAGVEGMLESGLQNAKLKSTYNIQRNIADNFGQALSNQNLNTNDQLMEAWDQYSPMSHISRKDIRGGSTLGRLWNTNMASIKGAEAGWNTGGGAIGAIIGGVVGLGTGIAGWVTGGRKASRLRDRINNEIDIANEFGYQNLAHQQANVEQKNLLRAEGNYVAYGGPLDKRLAGHQMQDIYGNGIPSANRFAGGGNAFVALGDQQTSETPLEQATKEKSLTETLMPYIMQAKQAREQREALALQQRQMAEYEAQRQQQVAAQAAALAEAQGEAPVETIATTPAYSNKALLDSIKRFEGFSPKPIWDVDGYAIGYGDHNKKINDYYLTHPNETYSEAEASKLVEKTVADTRKILSENIPNWNELSYAQQDALTSYGYNIRGGAWRIIRNSPSLMKAITNKDWNGVVKNINAGWNQRNEKGQLLKGLRKRRNFERLPFLYPEMTTYGVLPDGTVVNPDDLLNVDLSKPYIFENGKWSNPVEYTVATDDTMPVYVSQKANGGNLFAFGTEDPYAAAGRRYKNARTALVNNGYSEGDATRLAKILATQAVLESGYRDNSDNNYGGHLDPRSRKRMHYNNEEDFWKAQIDTLSKKWPEWNKAQTLSDYYNTINHTDLGLDTLEKFNAYNKAHRGNEVYLYAPTWENKGYLDKLNSIYPRASRYYKEEFVAPQFIRAQEPVNKEIPSWDNLHFGFGGNLIPPKKQALLDRINSTSKANFVERAKDPNRKSITLKDGKKGTHLLGWSTEDNYAVVYPQIQEIDGNLVLFDNWRDAYNSAVERGDTLRMTPKQAKWYTKNYKKHYPFANGGNLFKEGGPDGKNKDYDYINNQLTPYFYNNPQGFWADTPEASNVRQWLYNNYPQQIEEYYANTPEEIRSRIPAKMLNRNMQSKNFMQDFQKRRQEGSNLALGIIGSGLATGAATPAAAVTAPVWWPVVSGTGKAFLNPFATIGNYASGTTGLSSLAKAGTLMDLGLGSYFTAEASDNLIHGKGNPYFNAAMIGLPFLGPFAQGTKAGWNSFMKTPAGKYLSETVNKIGNNISGFTKKTSKRIKNTGLYDIYDALKDIFSYDPGKTSLIEKDLALQKKKLFTDKNGVYHEPTAEDIKGRIGEKPEFMDGKSYAEIVFPEVPASIPNGIVPYRRKILYLNNKDDWMAEFVPDFHSDLSSFYKSAFGTMVKGRTPGKPIEVIPINPQEKAEAQRILSEMEEAFGDIGYIQGSTQPIAHGAYAGLPNDVEISMPKSAWNDFVKRAELPKSYLNNPISGEFDVSASQKLSKITGGRKLDIHFDDYNKELFNAARTLDPVKFAELRTAYAKKGQPLTDAIIKREFGDVLKNLKQSQLEYMNVLTDALVNPKQFSESFSRGSGTYGREKYGRPLQILMNSDKQIVEDVRKSIDVIRKSVFGKQHKLLSELNPNFDFGNVEANRKFLKQLGLPESLSSNKEVMRNIIEYYHMQKTGLMRGINTQVNPDKLIEAGVMTTYAPSGSTWSGAGGNNVMAVGDSGHGDYLFYKQKGITNDYSKIRNAEDLINRINLLDISTNTNLYMGSSLKHWMDYLGSINDKNLTERISSKFNLPLFYGQEYGTSRYVGQLSPDVESFTMNFRDGMGPKVELGRPLEYYALNLSRPTTLFDDMSSLKKEYDEFASAIAGMFKNTTKNSTRRGIPSFPKENRYTKAFMDLKNRKMTPEEERFVKDIERLLEKNTTRLSYHILTNKLKQAKLNERDLNKLKLIGATSGVTAAGIHAIGRDTDHDFRNSSASTLAIENISKKLKESNLSGRDIDPAVYSSFLRLETKRLENNPTEEEKKKLEKLFQKFKNKKK